MASQQIIKGDEPFTPPPSMPLDTDASGKPYIPWKNRSFHDRINNVFAQVFPDKAKRRQRPVGTIPDMTSPPVRTNIWGGSGSSDVIDFPENPDVQKLFRK
jgi:hypothetical protein